MSDSKTLLVGDVGGTNARFAIATWKDGLPVLSHHESFPAEQYPTFLKGVAAFIDGCEVKPSGGVIAVAGPVEDGAIDLTNSPWAVSEAELATLGLNPVKLINDFEALAWGAPIVPADSLVHLGGPEAGDPHATLAVLGPGTGFGVSALVRDAHGREMAMPSEGGHACFPPGDTVEDEILRILRERYDRVSIERLICGPGLLNMHRALARFCAILGAVAGDIALTTGAKGGVYIAGGIAPRILDFLQASPFRRRFERKGRFKDYMADIPTWVITHKHAALLGAARVAFAEAG